MKFSDIGKISADTFREFKKNDPLRLGSSTSFFTVFSIAPIIILIMSVFGIFLDSSFLRSNIFYRIRTLFGVEVSDTIETIFTNIQELSQSFLTTFLGLIFLAFIASTLVIVVQNSINQIWKIRQKPEKQILRQLQDRGIALAFIIFAGLFFLIIFLSDALMSTLKDQLQELFPTIDFDIISVVQSGISYIIEVAFFAIIYKYLPSAHVQWKTVAAGAIMTVILFNIGKLLLVNLLISNDLGSIYGAWGSVVLVLLFVFYSSLILYLGVAFTKVFAEYMGWKIRPKTYAVKYKITDLG